MKSNADTRVVFMGTSEFAVPALIALAQIPGVEVVGVYTAPDGASRRGTRHFPSPVKEKALQCGFSVYTPTSLCDRTEVDALVRLAPHLIVVAAYGFILPREILDIPSCGCVNIHASLLPRWRGAAPIQWSILAGDTQTGVSLMRMDETLDTGDYCAQVVVPLDLDSRFDALNAVLAQAGARLLSQNLASLTTGAVSWLAQDASKATYAPKIRKSDMILRPEMTARGLYDRIRASSSSAPARTAIQEKEIRICQAALVWPQQPEEAVGLASVLPSGCVRFCNERVLMTGCDPEWGALCLTYVKPAGGREMQAAAWARGMRLESDLAWG